MGFYATEWLYANPPEIPRGISKHVGAERIRAVLQYLAHRADDDTGETCPSHRAIAAALGMFGNRRDIAAALDALTELGLIMYVGPAVRRVHGTIYRVAVPADKARQSLPNPEPIRPGIHRDSPPIRPGIHRERPRLAGDKARHPLPDQLITTTSSNSPTHGFAREAAPTPDDEPGVKIAPERVRAILETNGAARRLTGRTKPGPLPELADVAAVEARLNELDAAGNPLELGAELVRIESAGGIAARGAHGWHYSP